MTKKYRINSGNWKDSRVQEIKEYLRDPSKGDPNNVRR